MSVAVPVDVFGIMTVTPRSPSPAAFLTVPVTVKDCPKDAIEKKSSRESIPNAFEQVDLFMIRSF
jgi:hypothetical protein